jgi:type IV pilus assembly protein PilQ
MNNKMILTTRVMQIKEIKQVTKMKLTALLSLFIWSFITVTAYAVDLENVEFSSLPGNQAKISLTFSDAIADPHSFATNDPARIILDFAGVKNNLNERTTQVNIGVTKSLTAIEAGGRTRMVVNLLEKVPYSVVTKGNQVILTVNGSTLTSSEPNGLSNQASISDIDFRRGEEGEARLIVKFTDQSPSLDVKEERGNIVVDILATALPEKLNRRLDVVDFATPVTFIDTESKGANTRLTLTTTGEYEHLAYQSENALVIEVKPLSEQQLDEQKKRSIWL